MNNELPDFAQIAHVKVKSDIYLLELKSCRGLPKLSMPNCQKCTELFS